MCYITLNIGLHLLTFHEKDSLPVIEVYSSLNIVYGVEGELCPPDLLSHDPGLLQVLLLHPHLPVERHAGVVVVEVDPVQEQLPHDRVVHVGVVPEHLEAGEDLEVVEEVGVFCIKTSCDGEHARCVQEHVVGVGLLGLQQELKASWEDEMGKNSLYQHYTSK